MANNPGVDIATYLDTNSTALTLGTNLFVGPVRPYSTGMPVKAVFVLANGGREADRTLGSTTTIEVRHPAIQIRTRSTSFASGESLAQTIHSTLQSAQPSSYMDVYSRQSAPAFIEQDERGHYHFSDNFVATYST